MSGKTKKNVWIINHYATNTFFDRNGRHYCFAKYLKRAGYEVKIFCASTVHNSSVNIDTEGAKFIEKEVDGIPFVFVKTDNYGGNGKQRVKNMVQFYNRMFGVSKAIIKTDGHPDIILASSVHPLALVAGIKIGKKLGIPCVCEVRDLWPESIVAYGSLKRNSMIAKLLYQGEKWIYKKADRLIFTIEGGINYIKDQRWDKNNGGSIDLSKIYHINNGVDIEAYDNEVKSCVFEDVDLDNPDTFKVVYAGSIRKANNLKLIIDAAKYVKAYNRDKVKILIFGDGDEKEKLQQRCLDEKIDNVIFKGKVEKKFIPNILSKANLNVLNYSNLEIWKFGGSQNKSFEYLASGKPILSTITMGYDIIEKYNAGISLKKQDPETIGKAIISILDMEQELYDKMARNAKNASHDYDFRVLTNKLIDIIIST